MAKVERVVMTVKVPRALRERVRKAAKRERVKIGAWLVEAYMDYLARRRAAEERDRDRERERERVRAGTG